MLAVVAMRDRPVERQRHAIGADLLDHELLDQRVILSGRDCHPLTRMPVNRLRQPHIAGDRRHRRPELNPRGALLALQIDGAAVE